MTSSRVFHRLIEKVGNSGCYQLILLVIACGITFQMGSINFNTVFLFHQNDFQCPSDRPNCKDYVCALPPSQQEVYIDPTFTSLATRFGNYRCQTGGEIATA